MCPALFAESGGQERVTGKASMRRQLDKLALFGIISMIPLNWRE